LRKKPKTYVGEKTASSTNGGGKTVSPCRRYRYSHPVLVSVQVDTRPQGKTRKFETTAGKNRENIESYLYRQQFSELNFSSSAFKRKKQQVQVDMKLKKLLHSKGISHPIKEAAYRMAANFC
jgi:hypothetical protein